MSQYGLFDFGGTGSATNAGSTANNYNWGGSPSLLEAGTGLFSDALGAWVQIEGIKAQSSSSAQAQEATRSANSYPSGAQAPGYGGGGMMAGGGITATQAMVGGVVVLGLYLLLK